MAQYGGDKQFVKKEGHQTDEYAQNPLHSTTAGHDTGALGTTIHTATAGHDIGGKGTTMGTGAGHGYEDGKHGGTGGVLHRTGSGSSSSSEDDGEGGRRKKKGVMEKIKEKLPCGEPVANEQYKTTSATATNVGAGGGGHGYEGEEGHEKKGLMDKIKERLPGGNH